MNLLKSVIFLNLPGFTFVSGSGTTMIIGIIRIPGKEEIYSPFLFIKIQFHQDRVENVWDILSVPSSGWDWLSMAIMRLVLQSKKNITCSL